MLLALILAFSLFTRTWNLDYPKGYYFDEVYNAFTTQEFAKGNKEAYEWFHQSSVEGTAYGWTPPPLAKLLGELGILTFGDNEFGWRIVNALIGVGVIYLVYWLGKNLLLSNIYALLVAAFAALDGLLLVQSRINMNDIVATFFILVVFMAFTRYLLRATNYNLLMIGISLGLLIATKWTGLYALPVFGAWISLKEYPFKFKRILLIGVSLILIPAAIYILSYSQYFLLGGSWHNFVELQKQMWWYNTNLKATHTYQSNWWTWPLMLRPVWYYVDYSRPGLIANIYAMGNPVLWWLGIPAVIYTVYCALRTGNWRIWLIVVGFASFWLPWARAPRIMFLYHYLPSVPFLCLALAYALQKLNNKYLTIGICGLVLGVFIFFFPHWTAIHVPLSLDKYYFWMPGWK